MVIKHSNLFIQKRAFFHAFLIFFGREEEPPPLVLLGFELFLLPLPRLHFEQIQPAGGREASGGVWHNWW